MNDDQIKQITLNAIGAVLAKMPTLADRKCAMEFLWMTSYKLVRKTNGDDFVHGWLHGSLQQLNACQPDRSTDQPHCVQRCDAFPQTPTQKH